MPDLKDAYLGKLIFTPTLLKRHVFLFWRSFSETAGTRDDVFINAFFRKGVDQHFEEP